MPEQPVSPTSASSIIPFLTLSVSLHAPVIGVRSSRAVCKTADIFYIIGLYPFSLCGNGCRTVMRAFCNSAYSALHEKTCAGKDTFRFSYQVSFFDIVAPIL